MITQVALIWSGGAVATAFAVTGSAVVGFPMRLGLALLLAFFWPAALPWMCWQLFTKKQLAHEVMQQARTLGSPQRGVREDAEDTEKRVLAQLGIQVPADIEEQAERETAALIPLVAKGRGVTEIHPFATARALLAVAHAFVFDECERKLRDMPVPEGYVRKLAATILMTHADRLGKEQG